MTKPWRWLFRQSPAAPAHFFIACNLLLFLPALLFNNSRNFWNYGFNEFCLLLFPLFLVTYCLLSLPIKLIKPQWHHLYSALISSIAFMLWASDFWVGSHGLNDGKTFVLITDSHYFYMNFLLIAGIGITAGIISFYYIQITNTLLRLSNWACLFFVIIFALSTDKAPFLNYQQSEIELATFSKQKNVLVILLDSFQSDFLDEILKRKPEWADQLHGFTDYINAASTASGTLLSLPTIHSGQAYQLGQDLIEFYQNNIEQNSFLSALQKKGYRALSLNPYMGYTPKGVARLNQNYLSCPHWGAFCEAAQLINYSLFNAVPHAFKKYIYNEGFWLLSDYFPSSVEVSNQALTALATHLNNQSSQPTVKFLHLYSAHAPAILDESCHLTHQAIWTREAALNQAQCAMGHVIAVIQALKRQNLYDNTLILVIADHGAGLPKKPHQAILTATGNPLFLFKPQHSRTPLTFSPTYLGLLDIKSIICESSQDCLPSPPVSSTLASLLKERHELPFQYYTWENTVKIPRVFPYKINGSPRRSASWHKVPRLKGPLSAIAVTGDFFQDYAGSGWGYTTESTALRWAIKKRAALDLPLPDHKNVQITLTATTPQYNPQQTISVWVNHHWIGQYPVPVNKYSQIVFEIPRTILTKKAAHIQFEFAQANRAPGQANAAPLAIALFGSIYIR